VDLNGKTIQILDDPMYRLNATFQKLPLGRRLKVPLAKENMLKNLLLPLILVQNVNVKQTV